MEKVDFINGAGYLDEDDARERMGLGAGPQIVVANLAVMDLSWWASTKQQDPDQFDTGKTGPRQRKKQGSQNSAAREQTA